MRLMFERVKNGLLVVALNIERKRQNAQQVPLFQQGYLLQRCQNWVLSWKGVSLKYNVFHKPKKENIFCVQEKFLY